MFELQPPKPRKDPAKAAEQRSYERSYARAKKDAAQAKGAADGMADALADTPGMDAVVKDARQRHPAAPQSKPSLPKVAPEATTEQRFVEVPARGKQYRVPDPQWYSLTADQKSRFLDAIDGAGQQEKDESVALQSVNQLLDLRDKDQAKASKREAALMDVIAELTARVTALEAVDRSHKVEASQELTEQLQRNADAVINAASVEASLRNQTAQSQVTHDQQGIEAQARIQAQEQPIARMEGKATSTMTLVQERSNAAVEQVSIVESKVARADVRVTELGDRVDLITDLPSKAQLEQFVRDTIDRELTEKITDDRIERVVKERFVPTAPTTSADVLDRPKVEMIPNVATDEMQRQVDAAIKRGGK